MDKILNAFTVDVEDWFCVSNFEDMFSKSEWPNLESRVKNNTERLLKLLQKYDTHATFFILGWIAERHSEIVKDIVGEGHEIASHGYFHKKIQTMSRKDFEEDLRKSLDILETIISRKVFGFRAPSFSLSPGDEELFDILLDNGIRYDSSLYPQSINPSYGKFDSPVGIHKMPNGLIEIPLNSIRIAGRKIPFSGGAYFRIYPYVLTRKLIKGLHRKKINYVFYVHPWEIDAQQPVVKTSVIKRFRHYHNLKGNYSKLEKLLSDFKFGPIRALLNNEIQS